MSKKGQTGNLKIQSNLPSGLVGVSNLPIQEHRKVSREGVNFTIMVVGESGSGKTTLINTLFSTPLLGHKKPGDTDFTDRTVKIEVIRVEVEEKGFPLKLTVVDTPGLGDYVNNNDSWKPLVDFIDARHEDYLRNEGCPKYEMLEDLRVHACLYLIQPTGRTLKSLDIKVMKELGSRVNLIPVISKGDTISKSELPGFKDRIRTCLAYHKINVYTPSAVNEDEDAADDVYDMISSMPFAVIGSESMHHVNGELVYGRKYLWGVAEVENEKHCEFKKLRTLLMRSHMYDLMRTTEKVHYENYRTNKFIGLGRSDSEPEALAIKNLENVIREEEQLRQRFSERVKIEETRFKQWEQRLHAKRDELNKDLEQCHRKIKQLQEEVERLQQSKKK